MQPLIEASSCGKILRLNQLKLQTAEKNPLIFHFKKLN